jgi:hypothetical protein
MIKENSGKLYRIELEHNQGYAFVETYDFTDISEFDGRIVYIYNLIEFETKTKYNLIEIKNSGIGIGPIRMMHFPATRGKYATKFIGQNTEFMISEIPKTKELNFLKNKEINWDNFDYWYYSDSTEKGELKFVNYSKVRKMETRILASIVCVTKKTTMKKLIDDGKEISKYYDLSEIGNYNLFVQLINTYYPLEKTIELIKDVKNPYLKS